ncbi:MAG: type VII toxin-antitoxin system MntA family adenylyltransferase antitoxin [Betaproteobacteria bacterium]
MAAHPLEELEEKLRRALEPRAEILEAYLFGSQATGRAQAHSDIDVAVYIDRTRAQAGRYGYSADVVAELVDALHASDIDVVVLNEADPVLYHRVLRDGRRLFSRDLRATTTREGYALSRYCDHLPLVRKIEAARRTGWPITP